MLVLGALSCRMLKDLKDMETLSELGVLFLLYEQGLELSLDRLKVSTALCIVQEARQA
jgi:Kef-type K+ transport system membrane component KefB